MPRTKKAAESEETAVWTMQAPLWMSHFNGVEHFYDGSTEVVDGIARVPLAQLVWVRRLQMNGYDFATEEDRVAFSLAYNR